MLNRAARWTSVAVLAISSGLTIQARDLTFDQRVEAQAALERVYYSHQLGATRKFDEAVPRAVLEAKVHKYLEQSVALERLWSTPVTGSMLAREQQRMERGTQMPKRLAELYAALGNDSFLIQECLARAILVNRLTHNFFDFDQRIHGAARAEAERLADRLRAHALDPRTGHPARGETVYRQSELQPAEFSRIRENLPPSVGQVGAVIEGGDEFSLSIVLDETPTELQVATYRVAKASWSEWWAQAQDGYAEEYPRTVADSGPLPGPSAATGLQSLVDDTWDNGSLSAMPEHRAEMTAIWTGTEMIVWGGRAAFKTYGNGGRYDPATDYWSGVSTVGAPALRRGHSAIWTGSRMVVWGGLDGINSGATYHATGGRYDPLTDTWTAVSTVGAPTARAGHSAVWTGNTMIVWGGDNGTVPYAPYADGKRYDPVADTWGAPTSMVGAPSARSGHDAVWTGSRMIVWSFGTGGRYDPVGDTWTPTSAGGASTSYSHSMVWTGTEMIVWGGGTGVKTGWRYNPVADTWQATSTVGAPQSRYGHSAVWTGNRMIVWGGSDVLDHAITTGGSYDPAIDAWTVGTSQVNVPVARTRHAAVWTGSQMIVWGGYAQNFSGFKQYYNTGGRYDVATSSWTPTSASSGGGPYAPEGHVCWSGNRMIVWGGPSEDANATGPMPGKPGGQYDPATDSWQLLSTLGAPGVRKGHTVVCTGDEMIVWGGFTGTSPPLNSGGRYSLTSDTWVPTGMTGAPEARERHTAVWTGSQMIVWGGFSASGRLNTGGIYSPATDTWTPTSMTGAPEGRSAHTAVWTGTSMIVWGGMGDGGGPLGTGGRFFPTAATHNWLPTKVDSLGGRVYHTAVWTGSVMIVWGGDGSPGVSEKGDRYNPTTDSWAATAVAGAPQPRKYHVAAWTGEDMIVWGGSLNAFPWTPFNTGGRYNLSTNTWSATSTIDAPTPRTGSMGVWAGDSLLVWGGGNSDSSEHMDVWGLSNGGRYIALQKAVDDDGDGFSDNAGDCNDSEASVYPGAIEVCDGLDNDCNQTTDDILSETVSIETAARSIEGNAVLYVQDPNPPAQVTGYDIYRSADASLPIGTWSLLSSNVQDADGGTAGVQCVDSSGDVSPTDIWFYDVTAFNTECSVEGPH